MTTMRITPSVLEEWRAKEHGSWEDHGRPREGHVLCVLSRHNTRLVWESPAELSLLIESAGYHRNAWDSEQDAWMAAMDRLFVRLSKERPCCIRCGAIGPLTITTTQFATRTTPAIHQWCCFDSKACADRVAAKEAQS